MNIGKNGDTIRRSRLKKGKDDNDDHDRDDDERDDDDRPKKRPKKAENCFPPIGACFPTVPGAKHKLDREHKLAKLADEIPLPSSIAAGTIHMARRFVRGKKAATPLERAVFPVLRRLPRELLSCTVEAFDAIPLDQRNRLFAESLLPDPSRPLDETTFTDAVREEIVQRVGMQVFDDPQGAEEERPGLIRVFPPDAEINPNQVVICSLNGLRTNEYANEINIDDYLPSEFQHDCEIKIVDGQSQVDCQVRTTDCPGNFIFTGANPDARVCMRVPEIATGDTVILEGVNYFSVDTKVRLTDTQTETIVREVDTHVWGDIDTPVNEVVNGETVLINDCRVKDRLTFQVPEDLPSRIYRLIVVVPNITGDDRFGPDLISNPQYINVIPPATARFEIVAEQVICREETSPEWFGSDELGVHTLAAAFDLNFQLLELPNLQDLNDASKREELQDQQFEEGDMDSGDRRENPRKLFVHDQPILGMLLVVLGDEIDSRDAYEEQITSSMDIFIDIVKKEIEFIGAGLLSGITSGKISIKDLLKFAAKHPVILAIAAAVLIAIDVIIALWAPADPLIRDSIALSITELDGLTSVSVPAPDPTTFSAENGIVVNVNKTIAPVKNPTEYHETREYVGEDSRYEITYRYSRVA